MRVLLHSVLCTKLFSKAGGAADVDITKEMRKVRNSHRQYTAAQELKKKKQSEGQKKLAEKKGKQPNL